MTIANRIARRLALLAAVPGLSLAFAAQAQTVVYYHTDALGSVVAATDASRNVIGENEYEPYGKVVNHALQDGPGYTGHVADAQTGLIYMQQRYYDDDLGEFPTVDPVSANSMGGIFNRYAYANNNPYRYYDPDGRRPEDNTTPPDNGEQPPECDAECKRAEREQRERERHSDMIIPRINPAGDMVEFAANTYERAVRRTSFTASGSIGLGVGVEGVATKTTRPWQHDKVGLQGTIGVGAYAGANANFRLFSWGAGSGATDMRLKASTPGYFKLKVGLGLSLGISGQFNDRGGGSLSLTLGAGIGAEAMVKPPVTLGWEKEL